MDTRENYLPTGDPQQLPPPATELDQLNIFIGEWHAEGYTHDDNQPEDSSHAAMVKWTSDESYEWMSGNYFMIHRWNARIGKRLFKGVEIFGYDVTRKQYFTRFFDNDGNVFKYMVSQKNNSWTFKNHHTRTSIIFSSDENTMTFIGEWKPESGDWSPLCCRQATKVR